jgi:uncharacterized protein (TIGR03083 family)
MSNRVDYIDQLARESARFADAIGQAAAEARVPTCPDWNSDDLLWHLGEVQWFWAAVVREGVSGDEADKLKPERPADRAGLEAFYQQASRDLGEILAASAPDAVAWTWSDDDQTVGFIRRRQAHEALIHRIDAELTAGVRTPIDAQLAADGVDEALRVMYGGVPDWGTFTPDPARTVRFLAQDTGDSWHVTLGLFTGTDPDGGVSYSEPDIHAAEKDSGAKTAAEISGSAADLDCWLWHRPTLGPIQRSGDPDVLGDFDAAIKPGIN